MTFLFDQTSKRALLKLTKTFLVNERIIFSCLFKSKTSSKTVQRQKKNRRIIKQRKVWSNACRDIVFDE